APPTAVRVRILSGYREEIANLDAQERQTTRQLAELVSQSGSTLGQLCGLATVSVAELLVEVGDPRRCWSRSASHAALRSVASGASTALRR
ncbi:MAG: hypothetical protein WBP81_13575, partial [Solirubrobacteraceae bacterium]